MLLSRRLLVLLALLMISSPSLAQDKSCEVEFQRTNLWIEVYLEEYGRLPVDYSELSGLPISVRKEMFIRLDPGAKSELWRQHLSTFLDRNLKPEQREVLQQTISVIRPWLFQATPEDDPIVAAKLSDISENLRTVFSSQELGLLAGSLGPPEAPVYPWSSPVTKGVGGCGCNQHSDFCGGGWRCIATDCTKSSRGCGLFWLYECNGNCCFFLFNIGDCDRF